MSTGSGSIPPSGPPGSHIPGVTKPQHPPTQGKGGVTPRTQPNALPGGQSETPDTPIGTRSTAPTRVTPQLDPLKALQHQYHEQFNRVLSFQAQYDFLNFIPHLEQRLQDPSQFQDDLPFEIVYVKDGKMTSVLPPDPDVPPDSEEAVKLRTSLQKKLSVIDQKNGPEERRALREQMENTTEDLGRIGKAITEAGGIVPKPPIPKITLVIDENQFTAQAPAKRFNPGQTPQQKSGAGQFLLIPKDASRRMPPPVSPKPVAPPSPPVSESTQLPSYYQLAPNKGGVFSDIYLTKDTEADHGKIGNIASVNAGSTDLKFGVNAGGINGEFGKAFSSQENVQIEQAQIDFLNDTADEGASGYVIADPKYTDRTPLMAIYGHVSGEPDNQGTVLVSVFRDENCPEGIKKNRAMIYVVPPDGTSDSFDDKDDFLENVRVTAKNLIATQNKYNHWASEEGHPVLPVLRTCAFGGDTYCHPDSNQVEVAKAIRAGIKDYFDEITPDQNTIKEVQLEHDV
ncbi:hypothetical protein [Endozoicomonas arenosclerae]|uniref:hypothetical protein n=1 Tax=Endozoicomonas arenosclerae TaxID=1633495 RepID=UPI000A91D094|nr:hypothetical protein [Endozoicomonas arenosclerae]